MGIDREYEAMFCFPVRRLALVVAISLVGAPTLPSRAAASRPNFQVDVIGDLDRDGVSDVAMTVSAGLGSDVTVRSGSTGFVLWQRTVPAGFARVTPIRLGGGASGVVLTYLAAVYFDLVVEVVDASGTLLWQRHTPMVPVTPVAVIADPLVADVVAGGGDEVVVVLQVASVAAGGETALVLDGATGAPKGAIRPEPSGGFDWSPVDAGDVDGDGTHDLVWGQSLPGGKGVLRAYAGDGRVLWENAAAGFSPYGTPTPVGDVTGDGRADVTVWTGDDYVATALVSGRDGSVVWTRPGTATYPVGDIDGDHLGDVVLTDPLKAEGAGGGLIARAYSRGGRLRYERLLKLTQLFPAGDLTADGVTDFRGMWGGGGPPFYHGPHQGIVDGRTGRVLRTHPTESESALYGSVDCHGADTYTSRATASGIDLQYLDGRSGRRLWSLRLPRSDWDGADARALPRSRSRCGDSVVDYAIGDTGYGLKMVESNGRVRWTAETR